MPKYRLTQKAEHDLLNIARMALNNSGLNNPAGITTSSHSVLANWQNSRRFTPWWSISAKDTDVAYAVFIRFTTGLIKTV